MGSLPYGKRLVPGPVALVTGVLAIAGAAGAGWFAASQLADEPVAAAPAETLEVTAGTATIELRDGWQADARMPRIPGIDTTNAEALAPADGGAGRMVVALSKNTAAAPGTDLPAATVEALRVPLRKPERAAVGGLRGTGYTALSLRGVNGLADIYTFKTVAGLLTVSCLAPIDDPLPTGSCPADISAIAVSVPTAPDPAAGLRSTLAGVAADLDRARTNGRLELRRGADSDAQVRAARSIAAAYAGAAAALDEVAVPATEPGARLPETFRSAAAAYESLAGAARAHDTGAWTRASAAVDEAELAVGTALGAVGG
jgi:hypothetical protein